MTDHDEAARIADLVLAFRRIRPDELPSELFSETGWEYLLELFIADAKGERLTGREIAVRAKAVPTVASRWLKHLTAEGLVVGDGTGDLSDELTLSAKGLAAMETLMERAAMLEKAMLTRR